MIQYPPLKLLVLVFLVSICGYLATLNPALFRNDSPETITGCLTLGVTHPPGYPLFNLLGKLCYWPIGNPAFSYNFFASVLGSVGACLLCINLWILLSTPFQENRTDFLWSTKALASFAASTALAFSNGYWGNSIAAKGGVYVFQIILELAFLWILQANTVSKKGGTSKPIIVFFIFMLGFINHWPTEVLLVPALVVYLLAEKFPIANQTKALKTMIVAAALAILTLSLYLYLPIRASHYPPINFNTPKNIAGFCITIFRTEYSKSEFMGFSTNPIQTEAWQKAGYISDHLLGEFSVLSYPFIFGGIFWLFKKNRATLLFILILFLTTIVANIFYLKVEPIEYWHMDDHLLSSNWLFSLLLGSGIFGTFELFRSLPKSLHRKTSVGACLLVLFMTIGTFAGNWRLNDQKSQFLYFGYGLTTLRSMPQNTLFFAESDYDYFSLLYLKTILHKRQDTHLVLMPFLLKPHEEETLKQTDPTIGAAIGPSVFRDLIIKNQDSHPIMTMFPNGSFSKEYVENFKRLTINPSGLAVLISASNSKPDNELNYSTLIDFWGQYADSTRHKTLGVESLLRQTCALPYSNEAYFESLKIKPQSETKQVYNSEQVRTFYLMAERLYASAGNEAEANKAWFKAWLLENPN
jgi:hypothetical protein